MSIYKFADLKPTDYLLIDNFVTAEDNRTLREITPEQAALAAYERGLQMGKTYRCILINARSVWIGYGLCKNICDSIERLKENYHSNEVIGFHKNSKELLKGFLESGAMIIIERYTEDGKSETIIKELLI